MFTLQQIQQAFSKVKSGADFPQLVQDFKYFGVIHYENYVSDGRTFYFGANNFVVQGEPKYSELAVSKDSSSEKLKHALLIHKQGQTDYKTFCSQATQAGVEKWTTDILKMTVSYFDLTGSILVVETIPQD